MAMRLPVPIWTFDHWAQNMMHEEMKADDPLALKLVRKGPRRRALVGFIPYAFSTHLKISGSAVIL